MSSASISRVDDYHQRTKHTLQKYAAGPETLDWDTQPSPFRHFGGCEEFPLFLLEKDFASVDYQQLYRADDIPPAEWNKQNLAALLELSFGLSAWKQYGPSRWSLRCNPSSGNLHPTEVYVVQHDIAGLPPGVFHYRADLHALELRCTHTTEMAGAESGVEPGQLLIGLSSVHWREAWKYGERAWRYVQLDTGHAIACLRYAAALLGWQVEHLQQPGDQQISQLLGLDRDDDFTGNAEREHPDLLLAVSLSGFNTDAVKLVNHLLKQSRTADWQGQANRLDPAPMYSWPVIDEISLITKKPATGKTGWQHPVDTQPELLTTKISARDIIKQRRSAQALDADAIMSQPVFYSLLDKLLDRDKTPPWDCITHPPRIHPVIFVHNVDGLGKGLYALPRTIEAHSLLQRETRSEFSWEKPADCPQHIPLYQLLAANCRNAARTIACHQDIASDGAFSMAMLAEYEKTIASADWQYRELYWEAGMLGQVLYLEAEANNFRGTGIGCFFDDAMHEVLGITGNSLQDIYHFTVGVPIVDHRLVSLPPYGHLQDR